MAGENIVKALLHMTTVIKLYHWQTKSFARHKASCELFNNLTGLTDTFVETYIGRYERPEFMEGFRINVRQLSDDEVVKKVKEYIDYLKNELPKYLSDDDTDLLNIRDEMLGELNKTLYLFTLQ